MKKSISKLSPRYPIRFDRDGGLLCDVDVCLFLYMIHDPISFFGGCCCISILAISSFLSHRAASNRFASFSFVMFCVYDILGTEENSEIFPEHGGGGVVARENGGGDELGVCVHRSSVATQRGR